MTLPIRGIQYFIIFGFFISLIATLVEAASIYRLSSVYDGGEQTLFSLLSRSFVELGYTTTILGYVVIIELLHRIWQSRT